MLRNTENKVVLEVIYFCKSGNCTMIRKFLTWKDKKNYTFLWQMFASYD